MPTYKYKGTLVLTNPTSNVTFSISGEPVSQGFNNIHLKWTWEQAPSHYAKYSLNGGSYIDLSFNTEVILNNVESLSVKYMSSDGSYLKIDTSTYITNRFSSGDIYNKMMLDFCGTEDITSNLQDNCYVSILTRL